MRHVLAIVALTALCSAAVADGVTSLEGANLGTHWYGPNYTLDDLKGRVVVIEMWGYN